MKHLIFVGYLHSQLFLARSPVSLNGGILQRLHPPSPHKAPDWGLRAQVGGGGDGGSHPLPLTLDLY